MRRVVGVLVAVAVAIATVGCAADDERRGGAAARCTPNRRLGIVAQSVPTASYVPCVTELRPGWHTAAVEVRRGRASFDLVSDRAEDHPVAVRLLPECDVTGAVPITPRGPGVRTYRRLQSIDPRYAGVTYDVFPGGCVTYAFDFERGPHIGLVEDLESTIALFPRRELRVGLEKLGFEL